MRKIAIFLKAVAHHWGSLVTGGVIIGVIATYQGTGHTVPPLVYWTIAAIATLIASYRAWLDQFSTVERFATEAAARANLPPPVPRLDVHVSQSGNSPDAGPPMLGMRTVQPEEGLRRAGIDGSLLLVEFRLRHLSGRPATSIEIEPIFSQNGHYSIRFDDLSFLANSEENALKFEVWKLDQRPSRKAIALGGATQWLSEFLGDCDPERNPTEHPFIIWFRDGVDSRNQRFRLLYHKWTDGFQIIDDYPPVSVNYDSI